MKKKLFNKKINYKNWAIILTIIALSFASAWLMVRCWEMDKQISLFSSSISQIINYHQEKIAEEQDKSDDEFNSEPEPKGLKEILLEVSSAGYYYSPQGDQLGIGPLPPIVNRQTNYWIFWQIEKFNQDLKDFTLTAQLPENIIWTGRKTLLAGNLKFGQETQRVVWAIDHINQKSGPYRVGFEISLIPSQDDLGKVLNLLTSIQYQAADKSGQQIIKNSLNNITTNLTDDQLASGQGKVVSSE